MARESIAEAGAVIWYDGAIVLRRNKLGRWLFPKGHLESHETAAETAQQEAEEETGLEVELLGELGSVSVSEGKESFAIQFYAFRATGRGRRWQQHENKDAFLIPPDQVAGHLSFPELRQFWEYKRQRVYSLVLDGDT